MYILVSMMHTARVLVLVVAARHLAHPVVPRSRGVYLHMTSPEVYLMSRDEVSSIPESQMSTMAPYGDMDIMDNVYTVGHIYDEHHRISS